MKRTEQTLLAKMTQLLESVAVGYQVPKESLVFGQQMNIAIPNPMAYECPESAVLLFADDTVFLSSKTTGECYRLILGMDYESLASDAKKLRRKERLIISRNRYMAAEVIGMPGTSFQHNGQDYKLGGYPIVSGVANKSILEDYSPIGIGELKKQGDSLLQAFYSPHEMLRHIYHNNDPQKIEAVRDLTNLDADPMEAYDCIHIHRLIVGAPIVWVVGYQNAMQALQRFPSFSVYEAFNLKHLYRITLVFKDAAVEKHEQAKETEKDTCFNFLTSGQQTEMQNLHDASNDGTELCSLSPKCSTITLGGD